MANISVNKSPTSPRALTAAAREWDPFRIFRELARFEPFAEIAPRWSAELANFNPSIDVKETPEAFVFSADVPGVKQSDLDVQLAQNRLTISGKRDSEKTEKNDTYYSFERSYGSFSRAFALPEEVDGDKIHAELKEGVLTVMLPKKPGAGPKKVSVKAT